MGGLKFELFGDARILGQGILFRARERERKRETDGGHGEKGYVCMCVCVWDNQEKGTSWECRIDSLV